MSDTRVGGIRAKWPRAPSRALCVLWGDSSGKPQNSQPVGAAALVAIAPSKPAESVIYTFEHILLLRPGRHGTCYVEGAQQHQRPAWGRALKQSHMP
jgi:hypothetical protein